MQTNPELANQAKSLIFWKVLSTIEMNLEMSKKTSVSNSVAFFAFYGKYRTCLVGSKYILSMLRIIPNSLILQRYVKFQLEHTYVTQMEI